MADNYIMYKGEKYDIPDSTANWLEVVLKKKNRNPFWSKETIKIGDTYCDSSDSYIEERAYDDYSIENAALTDARLMKTKRDAEVVCVRELLNRKLWQYKYEHDTTIHSDYRYYLWRNLSGTVTAWSTSGYFVGQLYFNDPKVCAEAKKIIEEVLAPYEDDAEFVFEVLGVDEKI